MFKFKKQKSEKKAKKGQAEQSTVDSKLVEQIHVMPQRFYVQPKKKHSGLAIIIIAGVILLGVLAGAGFYFSQDLKNDQLQPLVNANANHKPVNANQNTNQPVVNQNLNQNLNQSLSANTNTNVSTTTNINVNININTNANTNTNVNTNTNTNTNVNANPWQPLPTAPDDDNDGLTLMEENLYGTNPEISDTDGDGYKDGAEILSGYDPTRPAANVVDSGLFLFYSHPVYSIVYPQDWILKEQDQEKNEVLFIADSGEFMEILVVANPSNTSLVEWYQKQFPTIDLGLVRNVRINNLVGFRHPDNQSYYLAAEGDPSTIFLLIYNIGNFNQTNFITTFTAIVKSFQLLP